MRREEALRAVSDLAKLLAHCPPSCETVQRAAVGESTRSVVAVEKARNALVRLFLFKRQNTDIVCGHNVLSTTGLSGDQKAAGIPLGDSL